MNTGNWSRLYTPFPVAVNKVLIPLYDHSATIERSLSNCFARMVYAAYKKQRILHFYLKGYKAPTIQKFLAAENLVQLRWHHKIYQGVLVYGVYLQTAWFE